MRRMDPLVRTYRRPYERLPGPRRRPLIARDDRPRCADWRPTEVACRRCGVLTGNTTTGICLACESPLTERQRMAWMADELREWIANGLLNGYITDDDVLVIHVGHWLAATAGAVVTLDSDGEAVPQKEESA